MIYLDYWCLLNLAPEGSTFLPTLFASSVFLSFSPLQPKRTQKSGLFSKREGRGEAWSEESFPSTDDLSWRRGTVGGKNKCALWLHSLKMCLFKVLVTWSCIPASKQNHTDAWIEDKQRNLQHDMVKELRVWGQRSWFLDTWSWGDTLVASFHHP